MFNLQALIAHLEDGPDDTRNIVKELGIRRNELNAIRSHPGIEVKLQKTSGGITNIWSLKRGKMG